ncbi:MAG: four helix bundle protein [Pirellulales bacterium]
MGINSYRDLIVWREGMQLATAAYRATESFPQRELYGLTSQLRRCAVSVPSNIAEGHARSSTKDYLRHLSIALGSLAELETQLILSKELGYLPDDRLKELLEFSDTLGRRLRSLQQSLQRRLRDNL